MATDVYELTGSMRNIEVDDELIFPNVQTCLALVAVCGGQLVGVHMTIGDRRRTSDVARELTGRFGNPSDLYVVGPISSEDYNYSSFANFGGAPHLCNIPGYIDVRARMVGGRVEFAQRPMGGGDWTAIPADRFIP